MLQQEPQRHLLHQCRLHRYPSDASFCGCISRRKSFSGLPWHTPKLARADSTLGPLGACTRTTAGPHCDLCVTGAQLQEEQRNRESHGWTVPPFGRLAAALCRRIRHYCRRIRHLIPSKRSAPRYPKFTHSKNCLWVFFRHRLVFGREAPKAKTWVRPKPQ